MDQSSTRIATTTTEAPQKQSEMEGDDPASSPLRQVESMLDYIRANLDNIRRTWGVTSSQYGAASEIMQKYFNENIKKLNLNDDQQQASLDDLLAKMSLDEMAAPNYGSPR